MAKIKTLGMTPCMSTRVNLRSMIYSSLITDQIVMMTALKLLGFMPRDQIKPEHIVKHAYQIYPNDTVRADSFFPGQVYKC